MILLIKKYNRINMWKWVVVIKNDVIKTHIFRSLGN